MEAMRNGAFYRGDYHHAAFMALLFLGVMLRPGAVYKFLDLAEPSNARLLQRGHYFLIMTLLMRIPEIYDIYSEEERRQIHNLGQFSALYYVPYFLQSVFAARAPMNDLNLICRMRQLRMYDPHVADPVLKCMDRHTNYLG